MMERKYSGRVVHYEFTSGLNLFGCGFIYQEDNDPKCTSKLYRDNCTKKK